MPMMGKDTSIDDFPWLAETGLTPDQFSHVWTYGAGEDVPERGEYRNLGTGDLATFVAGDYFPAGRWVVATDVPTPRHKMGTRSEEITQGQEPDDLA